MEQKCSWRTNVFESKMKFSRYWCSIIMGAIKRMSIRKQRKLKPVEPMSHSTGVGKLDYKMDQHFGLKKW